MPLEAGVRAQVDAWLRKADGDLRNTALVLPAEDAPLDTVAFHAQQAGEKALEALLTARQTPFPKIHDLEELAGMLPRSVRAKLGVADDDLAMSSQLGVGPRDPGFDDDLGRSVATHAADVGRELVARVRAIVASGAG